VLQGSREQQSRILLRQHLSRVRRAQQDRYRKMRRARIDLTGLRHLAEDIVDDHFTITTSSKPSIPGPQAQPLRHGRYPLYHQPEPPAQTPTHKEGPRTVPLIAQDIVIDHSRPSIRRPETYAIYERTLPERRPSRRPDDRKDRRRSHSSNRSRLPSISRESGVSYDSGFVDESPTLRTLHVNENNRPSISYNAQQDRPGRRGNKPSGRSTSTSRESSYGYDSGIVDDSHRLPTPHINEDHRPPVSYNNQQNRSGRHRERSRNRPDSTSRESSFSHDSGFVDDSPRRRTSHVNETSGPPISYETQQELRGRPGRRMKKSGRGSSSESQDSGFVDGSSRHGRSDLMNSSHFYEQQGSSRRRSSSERSMDVDSHSRYVDETLIYPRQPTVEDTRQLGENYFAERRHRRQRGE
jgi:hypothetical protein